MLNSRRIEEYWVEFDRKRKSHMISLLFDAVDAMKIAMILLFVVFAFVFRIASVSGTSMKPTFDNGDWLLLTNDFNHISRGDVVVISQPWSSNIPLIKRVIGIEGDTVDIDFDKGEVFVNGQKLDEPYIAEPTHEFYDVTFPVVVGEGKLFVMGDNRNNSMDSRDSSVGLIDKNYVMGKPFLRFYPEYTKPEKF